MMQNDSVKYVCQVLLTRYNDSIKSIQYLNNNKHTLIKGKKHNYYVLHKREPFYSFGKIFKDRGIGESINKKSLDLALKHDCILIFNYREKLYSITAELFKKIAEEGDFIRVTKTGEMTFSIPFHSLLRWY